jgi:hypothetical protein
MPWPAIAPGTSRLSAIVPRDAMVDVVEAAPGPDHRRQLADCTATMRGNDRARSRRPSAASSRSAFQIPTRPVPPPVG